MNNESIMRLHRIFNILFSIVLVIAGICLIAGCLSIYFSGDQPFSRESVAATFSGIAFPVYLALAMTIINIIWGLLSPTDEKKKPIQKKKATIKKNVDASSDEEADILSAEKKYRPYRNAILIAAIILIVAGLLNEGTVAVLAKAINICTECIGLG